jgi:hypothetical protein
MLHFLNGLVMTRPEVMIGAAHSKFDAEGKLTDQPTPDVIVAHLCIVQGVDVAVTLNDGSPDPDQGACRC